MRLKKKILIALAQLLLLLLVVTIVEICHHLAVPTMYPMPPAYIQKLLYQLNLHPSLSREYESNCDSVHKSMQQKLILVWNDRFGLPIADDWTGNVHPCPELDDRCQLTWDHSHLPCAEAVMMHHFDTHFDDWYLPQRRRPEQIFIYYNEEPPTMTDKLSTMDMFRERYKSYFNMTVTYRSNADVRQKYVAFNEHEYQKDEAFFKILHEKMATRFKSVAWIVTNCQTHSKREHYVQNLAEHIDISRYGDYCKISNWLDAFRIRSYYNGYPRCSRDKEKECIDHIQATYWFHIAMENANCKEYVSEKFMRTPYLVPIVLRRSIYNDPVPDGSFIAVDDYEDFHEVAAHLRYLMSNQTAYLQYFQWRNYFLYSKPNTFCEVCKKLANKIERRQPDIFQEYVLSDCDSSYTDMLINRQLGHSGRKQDTTYTHSVIFCLFLVFLFLIVEKVLRNARYMPRYISSRK